MNSQRWSGLVQSWALLVVVAAFSAGAMAQDESPAPPPDELEGDFGAPYDPSEDTENEGAGDGGPTDPDPATAPSSPSTPASERDPAGADGEWGAEGEVAPPPSERSAAPRPVPCATPNPAPRDGDPYASEAETETSAGKPEAAPVEGLDDITTFATLASAAAAMNIGIGGAISAAAIVAAIVNPATLRDPFPPLPLAVGAVNCAWSCLAAPAVTGLLVAFLGDMVSTKRGTVIVPLATAFATALLVGVPVSLAATLGVVAVATPLARSADPVMLNILLNGITLGAAAAVGLAMSGATAGAYLLFAEDRRPGDPGGGMPGMTQPAHQASRAPEVPSGLKRTTASMAY